MKMHAATTSDRERTPRLKAAPRRGGVMVEFALVSLALYLLLAAVLGLGRWMAVVQSAQDAAHVAAREFALYPLPPDYDFTQALADPGFRSAVYDADLLVADLDATPPGPDLDAFFAAMLEYFEQIGAYHTVWEEVD